MAGAVFSRARVAARRTRRVLQRVRDLRYVVTHVGLRLGRREWVARQAAGISVRWVTPTAGALKGASLVEAGNPFLRDLLADLRAEDVFLDVGANCGFYSILAALCPGHPRLVVAVEPSPGPLTTLLRNVSVNDVAARVQVLECAMGACDGMTTFQMESLDPSAGTSHLDSGGARENVSCEGRMWRPDPVAMTVNVRSVDSLVAAGVLPSPTVVKVDVEGYEGPVFDGMETALRRTVRLLCLELHPGRLAGGESPETVLARLTNAGLRLVGSTGRGSQQHLLFGRDP